MDHLPLLHLITGLGPGGAEAQLVQVASGLAARGWPVLVAALDGRGPRRSDLTAAGVEVVDLGMRAGIPDPLGLLRLVRLIRTRRPRLMQSWLYHADLLGTLAAAMTGVPHYWNLRCSDMDLSRYGRGTRLVAWTLRFLTQRPLGIVCNSQAGQKAHLARGWRPRRWIGIPNGLDLGRWQPEASARFALRSRIGLPAEARIIVQVARHDPMKDYAGLMTALESVLPARPDTHAVLIGQGTENVAIPPRLYGQVHALGLCDDLDRLLPGADLACLSSAFGEGFPNVLGEALACGVPCVATDVGDAALIIGRAGRIVPPRDPATLAGALSALIDLPDAARSELGALGRRQMAAQFSLPTILDRYEALYHDTPLPAPLRG